MSSRQIHHPVYGFDVSLRRRRGGIFRTASLPAPWVGLLVVDVALWPYKDYHHLDCLLRLQHFYFCFALPCSPLLKHFIPVLLSMVWGPGKQCQYQEIIILSSVSTWCNILVISTRKQAIETYTGYMQPTVYYWITMVNYMYSTYVLSVYRYDAPTLSVSQRPNHSDRIYFTYTWLFYLVIRNASHGKMWWKSRK